MDKLELFKVELDYIKNENIKKLAETILNECVPDYFFIVSASSTGKYHNTTENAEGGLVIHTKNTIRMAIEMFRLDWWGFTEDDKDLIIVSLMFHDSFKYGAKQGQYTTNIHPTIAKDRIAKYKFFSEEITEDQFEKILNNIERHSGQWNKDKNGYMVMPRPANTMEKFVHMCDYLASRKSISVNLDELVSRE
jgi:hypothetical protein